MIGSHNSLTYLPVKHWYHKPIKFMAKCQSKRIEDQFHDYGVRLFDIRIRFKKGEPIIAHGPIEFKGDVLIYIKYLNTHAQVYHEKVYVRLILESNKEMKDQSVQQLLFYEFCEYCLSNYKNLIFFGGNRKYDWKVVYGFQNDPKLMDLYSSTTNIFGLSKDHWTTKIDDLWPWLYARLYNKRNIKRYIDNKDTNILFIDYINIR